MTFNRRPVALEATATGEAICSPSRFNESSEGRVTRLSSVAVRTLSIATAGMGRGLGTAIRRNGPSEGTAAGN